MNQAKYKWLTANNLCDYSGFGQPVKLLGLFIKGP